MKKLLETLRRQVKEDKKRRRTVNTLTGISALVVFVIVYVLILPAIAMDEETYCGLDTHEHNSSCYEQVLTCKKEEHQHSKDCYENGELVCSQEEHIHDGSCYKEELVCGKERHVHNKDCYVKPEPEEMTTNTEEIKEAISEESSISSGKTTEKTAQKEINDIEKKVEKETQEDVAINPLDISALLTENTGIWHQINTETDTPVWEKIDENTSLSQDEILRIHLALQVPKDGIVEGLETYYDLPEEIGIIQETADWLNDDTNGINQIITGSATPDQTSVSPEYLAGQYELIQTENETWHLAVVWDPYVIVENSKSAMNMWTDLYVTAENLSTALDGANKVVFREKTDELEAVEAWYKDISSRNTATQDDSDLDNDNKSTQEITPAEEDSTVSEKDSYIEAASTENDDKSSVDKDQDTTPVDPIESHDHDDKNSTGEAEPSEEEASVDSTEQASVGIEEDKEETTDEQKTKDQVKAEEDTEASEKLSDSTEEEKEDLSTEQETKETVIKDKTRSYYGSDYAVIVSYGDDAQLPKDVNIRVREIRKNADGKDEKKEYSDYINQAEAAIQEKTLDNEIISKARFFDITFISKGQEIEPLAPVDVKIEYRNGDAVDEKTQVSAIHLPDKDHSQIMDVDIADNSDNSSNSSTSNDGSKIIKEIGFTADSFSVYGVIYTVDFHYQVGDKQFDFSIPGGGFISFTDIIEALGITDKYVITSEDVDSSEAIRRFVSDVEDIAFSTPELVWTGKVEEDTTIGDLKDKEKLEIQYSDKLTDDQIAEINDIQVHAGDWALISLQPFDTEEVLTVTMKNGEAFTIQVTDAQMKKSVISASGETYEITVTYGEDALIPEGAELKVKEILPEDEEYKDLYEESVDLASQKAEEQGIDNPIITNSRLFDIEIHGEDGKIEPTAPVQVNIRLAGEKDKKKEASVVHFGTDGAESIDIEKDESEDVKDAYEVSFEADAFSVYTVQTFTSLANYLDGAKYALVSERGTNITSADNKNSVSNFAMISSTNNGTLAGKGVYKNGNSVGGHVTQWGFEDAGGNQQYYIYVMDGNTKKYVKASGNNLVLDTTGTAFTASVSNNKVRFSYYGQSITSTGDNPSTFVLANNNGDASLFNLCEVDPNYEEKEAKKVSAEDWKADAENKGRWDENDTIVIYRRIEHEDGSENLYVLATDGSLIPAYDGGDSIYYHCPENKNVNWHVVLGASGYYISNVVPEGGSESTVYLAPSVTNGTWSSESPVGLVLGGMGNSYGTTIENWDQAAYAYAGLHVDATNATTLGHGVAPGSGTTSDTFMFAVSDTLISEGTLHTVDTVDSASKGITMKIFNYGGSTYNYGYRNTDMQSVMGDAMLDDWNNRKSHVTKTVEGKLGSDGFPVSLTEGYGSYKGLFTLKTDGGVAESASDANKLFLQTYYDEDGMFRYSSMENFAHFNTSGDHAGEFTVYREAGTPNIPTANDHYYYYHGHFMPYNTLNPKVSVSRIVDQYGSITDKDMGRSFEDVYGLSETPDYYVGMTLEAKFVQPSGGTLENGDPVVFRFTGDDDMLVYIDGILVLDVGGIHEPLTGSINFETGTVYQPNFYNEGAGWQTHTTTLYKIFRNAYNNGLISADDWAKIKWVDADGDGEYDTFADHTTHSFNMFYLERGAGASNLDLQFNLQVVKKDEFTVRKNLPEDVKSEFVNQLYRFRAVFKDNGEIKALYPPVEAAEGVEGRDGAKDHTGKEVCSKVVYADRRDANGRPIEVPIDIDTDGYFYLRAGEAAVFTVADETVIYDVYEVDIDGNLIRQVDINGVSTQIDTEDGPTQVHAGEETIEDRSEVNVTNHPITQNLRVTKHITEDSLSGWEDDNPVFEFRVYLEQFVTNDRGDIVYEDVIDDVTGETVRKPKTKLVPYARSPYYLVKIPEGQEDNEAAWEYYTLTGENNAPVLQPHGTVCSITGRSGTINSIPPEYTIIIPHLAVGTHFYVEERRATIPEGYEFDSEKLKEGTYDPSILGASKDNIAQIMTIDQYSNNEQMYFDAASVGRIMKGTDAERKDAEFDVWNRKPAIEIPVEKKWVGGEGQNVTLALIRYMPKEKYTPEPGKGAIIIDHVADYGANNDSTALPSGFVATYAVEKYNSETEEYEVVATGTSGPFDVDPGVYRISTVVNNRGNEPVNYTYSKTDPVMVTVPENQSAIATVTSEYNYEQGGKIAIFHNASYEGGEQTGTNLPEGISVTYTIKDEATNRIVHRNVPAGEYDVPAGTYTVTANVSDPAAPETYVYQDTTIAENVSVASGGTASAELSSTYVYVAPKTYGYITINHESSGLTGISPNLPQNFQVTSYRIVGPTTINNAQLGHEYEVEAGNYTVIANVNYAPVVEGYVYAGTSNQEVVVGTGAHESVKLTSIYGRQGAIRIVHKSSGMTGTTAVPGDMSVQYTIVNNATGETLRSNVNAGTYSVPAGEYTVTATVSYKGTTPEGYFYLDTDPVIVTVTSDQTANANVVSRYGKNGTLQFHHISSGFAKSPAMPTGFNAQYTISGPTTINDFRPDTEYSVAPGTYTISMTSIGYEGEHNGYNYLGTEDITVTVESGENKTVNLTSTYEREGGNNSKVYLCVAYSPNDNGTPLTVPINSKVNLKYSQFYNSNWNQYISPNWELYYYNGSSWSKIEGKGGGVPGTEGVDIQLGEEGKYCVLINTDSSFSGPGKLNESIELKQSSASITPDSTLLMANGLMKNSISAVEENLISRSTDAFTTDVTRAMALLKRSTTISVNAAEIADDVTVTLIDPTILSISTGVTSAITTLNENLATNASGYEYVLDTSFGKQVVLSNPWTYTFDDLEELGEGSHPYYYALVEVEVPEDYEVSYTNNPVNASDIKDNMDARAQAQTGGTTPPALLTLLATNTLEGYENTLDISIIKIDETSRTDSSQTKLPNATFTLYKYTVPTGSSTGDYTVYPDESSSQKTTGSEEGSNYGTLTFAGLPDGQYKLSETEPPDGYVKLEDNDIYFDIVNGVLQRYNGAYTGTARSSQDEIAESDEVVNVTYAKAGAAFTVGNEPGVELPHTGGLGTRLYTILGILLLLLGGAGCILLKRIETI